MRAVPDIFIAVLLALCYKVYGFHEALEIVLWIYGLLLLMTALRKLWGHFFSRVPQSSDMLDWWWLVPVFVGSILAVLTNNMIALVLFIFVVSIHTFLLVKEKFPS